MKKIPIETSLKIFSEYFSTLYQLYVVDSIVYNTFHK